jgi:cyanate permease
MFGLVQFAASLFSAFNQNLLHWALSVVPWRELFNYVAIAGIVLLLAAALKLRDPIPIKATVGQSFGTFLSSVLQSLFHVASISHIWVAAAFGSLIFGVMLALGVVWAPKLLMVRGWDVATANMASSLLWLGLAAGCFVAPWISDRLRQRKLPIIIGIMIQLLALTLLLYSTPRNPVLDMALCFLFGFGNSAHMLAFSTAADVVQPSQIGTSAAIVNGMMFLVGGIMISRPGVRIGLGLDADLTPRTMELAQFAGRPLLLGVLVALVIAVLMRETYPRAIASTH